MVYETETHIYIDVSRVTIRVCCRCHVMHTDSTDMQISQSHCYHGNREGQGLRGRSVAVYMYAKLVGGATFTRRLPTITHQNPQYQSPPNTLSTLFTRFTPQQL